MDQYYFTQDKITDIIGLRYMLSVYRFKDQKIVFTEGCFDLMHRGHIKFLAQAAGMGDKLIVGLNSDSSAERLKGKGRPIQTHGTRSMILASLRFVDHVVVFEDETPLKLIKIIQPDVLVKGGDCVEDETIGDDLVSSKGGKVVTLDVLKGYSTTSLIERIKSR